MDFTEISDEIKVFPGEYLPNSPEGMCPGCNGLGRKQDIDVTRVVDPDFNIKAAIVF